MGAWFRDRCWRRPAWRPTMALARNAVREAMQHLAARGVVDLSRNRSPTIRRLDHLETLDILSVAAAMTALAAQAAARRYDPAQHHTLVASTLDALTHADAVDEPGMFSRARRHFYRILLHIGGNRELLRLFPGDQHAYHLCPVSEPAVAGH